MPWSRHSRQPVHSEGKLLVMPEKSSTATKFRILFLLQYLQANTDDDHVIGTNDLIALLEQNGFKANRDTIRDDIAVLNKLLGGLLRQT